MDAGDPRRDDEGPFAHILHPQKRAFLTAYAVLGKKGAASDAAGISRATFRSKPWQTDPEFVEAFDVAEEIAADNIEDEATRRAIEGMREYKFSKGGEPILHPNRCECGHDRRSDHSGGLCSVPSCTCREFKGEPYYTHSYSDTLLIVLMKMRGRFVDQKNVDVRGVIGRVDLGALPDAAVRRIAAGESIQAVLATLEGPSGSDAPVLEAEIVSDGDSDPGLGTDGFDVDV